MSQAWGQKLPQADALDRRIGACLHWTFLRHVTPTSPVLEIATSFLQTHNLTAEADAFADQLVPRLGNKVDVAHAFFDWFAEVPKTRVALEYVSSLTGTTKVPLVVYGPALRSTRRLASPAHAGCFSLDCLLVLNVLRSRWLEKVVLP